MEKKRILFYSHDTFGLGHINRVLSICRYLYKQGNVNILIVSGSSILAKLNIPAGIDYIKLPSVTKVGDDLYVSKYLNIGINQIIQMRSKILIHAAKSFRPDAFVVDNVPLGLKNEAQPTLEFLKRRNNSCRILLTMRDILDDPDKIKTNWRNNSIYEALKNVYDSILVFGIKQVYDIVDHYEIPEPAASKVIFCGYIDKSGITVARESIRNSLNVNGHRLILVTAGGGGDGDHLVENYLRMVDSGRKNGFISLVVLGPDFPIKKRKDILSLYQNHKSIFLTGFIPTLPEFMNAADLVVSMGGYNTMCEIMSLNKKAVIVPRVKPRKEQFIRAQCLSPFVPFKYIHPEDVNPHILEKEIDNLLSRKQDNSPYIDLNGLRRSARIFKEMLAL